MEKHNCIECGKELAEEEMKAGFCELCYEENIKKISISMSSDEIKVVQENIAEEIKRISGLWDKAHISGGAMEKHKCKECGRELILSAMTEGFCSICYDENIEKLCSSMTDDEIKVAIEKIANEIRATGELDYGAQEQLFKKLLRLRDINTSYLSRVAFEHEVFMPKELYKDCDEDIIDKMVNMLKNDRTKSYIASRILCCLAVRGGEKVLKAFVELENNLPKWREELHVNPSVYANMGGWTFDKDGKLIKTIFDKCYPMVKGTLEEKEKSPVKIGVVTDEVCEHCGTPIVELMKIDARDKRLDFLGIDGIITAKCCHVCMAFVENAFNRFTLDGKSEIIKTKGEKHQFDTIKDIEDFLANTYILAEEQVSLQFPNDWEGGSAVGGYGFWVNDCEIIDCPDCGKPMKYLAQIQWDKIVRNMDGFASIEVCSDCKIVSIQHQQS